MSADTAGVSACATLLIVSVLNAAGDRITEGKAALMAGRSQEAVRLLERLPGCDGAYYLGLARYRLKQLDQAIVDLQVASRCDPGNADPWLAIAAAYVDKGDDDRAVSAFDSALRLKPGDVDALRAASALDLRHERNERAIGKLEKLVTIAPDDAQARSDLGAAYAATGKLEKAVDEFRDVLRRHPDNASALMGLGNVYLKSGQTEEAINLLKKAAKGEPRAYAPRFLLASAYNTLGSFSLALAECEEALRLGGTDPEVYYHLARAYRGLGREEEGRAALARFSALRAQSKEGVEAQREAARLLNEAKPLVEAGRLPDSIALLERALALDPKNPQVAFRLAGLYYDTRQYEPARQHAREAIAIAPAEWLYHYLLGLVEEASGRLDTASQSFETAVRLNSSAADAFNQLGNIAMTRQDFAKAKRLFEQAIQLDRHQTAYRLNREAAERRISSK